MALRELWDFTNRTKTTREIVLEEWHEEQRLTQDVPNWEEHSQAIWDKLEKKKQERAAKQAEEVEINQTRYLKDKGCETHSLSNRELQNLVDPDAPEECKQGVSFFGQLIIAAVLAVIIMSGLFYFYGVFG